MGTGAEDVVTVWCVTAMVVTAAGLALPGPARLWLDPRPGTDSRPGVEPRPKVEPRPSVDSRPELE